MRKASIVLCAVLAVLQAAGQSRGFHFQRSFDAPAEGWYSISLPPDVFRHTQPGLGDIRILSIEGSDTTETQFIIRTLRDEAGDELVDLPIFNRSSRNGVQYLTVELKNDQPINRLDLSIAERNFDGTVQLEGSDDKKEWFAIDSLRRILSILDDGVDFNATAINFPVSHYKFLRMGVKANVPLTIHGATFANQSAKPGVRISARAKFNLKQDKATKESILDVSLPDLQLIDQITIDASSASDYYRAVTIEALRDSTRTQKGWYYSYDHLYTGYITSVRDHKFSFSETLAKRIRVTVRNGDNATLQYKGVTVSGPRVELVAQLKKARYILVYGNTRARMPSYDLAHFPDKIPADAPELSPGPPQDLSKPIADQHSFLSNKIWLWGILGVIIAVLGFFTLRMMKNA